MLPISPQLKAQAMLTAGGLTRQARGTRGFIDAFESSGPRIFRDIGQAGQAYALQDSYLMRTPEGPKNEQTIRAQASGEGPAQAAAFPASGGSGQ